MPGRTCVTRRNSFFLQDIINEILTDSKINMSYFMLSKIYEHGYRFQYQSSICSWQLISARNFNNEMHNKT